MNIRSVKKLILIFTLVLVFGPLVINGLYKVDDGYITMWGPEDTLLYLGSALASLGAVFIGVVATIQNSKSNEISKRLLDLQEASYSPYLIIDISSTVLQSFSEHRIDILVGLRNST